jgi:hypothetical protein
VWVEVTVEVDVGFSVVGRHLRFQVDVAVQVEAKVEAPS